ncbi:Neuropeptide Y receptor type 1 [Trichoplax sp. H2]|nr:Neuropeptide Y receptor type 1 [Trichoplax sp. H2]|eukprot:RDD36433.1 Neuropeptide Y receptor type 1 [Trichoplax sp. H2]
MNFTSNVSNMLLPAKITMCISISGLILNVFLCFVIFSNHFFRRTTYRLIAVTVISDAITNFMLTINYAFSLLNTHNVVFSRYLCKIVMFIMSTSYAVSIFTLCLIAVGNYIIIKKPLGVFPAFFKPHRTVMLSMASVVIAICISIPLLCIVDVYDDLPIFCDFVHVANYASNYTVFLIAHAVVLYVIPSILLIVTYGKIIFQMMRFNQPISSSYQQFKDRKRRKLIKVLSAVTMLDVIITWPCFASTISMAISRYSQRQLGEINATFGILVILSLTTTIAISIINPISFLALDAEIQKGSKYTLKKVIHSCATLNLLSRFGNQQNQHRIVPIKNKLPNTVINIINRQN